MAYPASFADLIHLPKQISSHTRYNEKAEEVQGVYGQCFGRWIILTFYLQRQGIFS